MAGNRFRLQGGLGNQLFIYYAAACYAIAKKQDLITFDVSGLSQASTERMLELDNFDLPIKYEISNSQIPRFMRAVITRINRLVPTLIRIVGYLQPKEVGFSALLLKGKYFETSGYFQSWRYPDEVKRIFPNHTLKAVPVSEWAKSAVLAARVANPILCHIRRGDFLKLQDSFGVLNYNYYLDAIAELRSTGLHNPVWVMTDSPAEISPEFLEQAGAELIREPAHTLTTDTFAVMQACNSFIISNSTFSWWAAYSSNARHVIAPNPWFKSMAEPANLIPKNWIRVQSSWS
jgi:hypothetical protein